jgi:hypothetical protein
MIVKCAHLTIEKSSYDLLLLNEADVFHDVLSGRGIEEIFYSQILDSMSLKHLDRAVPPVFPLRNIYIFLLVQFNLHHDHYVLQRASERL